MKKLNEEIKRMKSLFDDSRLYGNLNESAGGRFGWLDELFSLIDDAHAGKGAKRWGEFSMSYKNADEFLDVVKKNPDYVKLIDEEFPTYVGKMINDVVTNGSVSKTTPDLLSDGYMKSILNTFKRNGADLTMEIDFNGVKKTISQHIQDAWDVSTQKRMVDDLQDQITKRLESDAIWHPDSDVEKIFSDVSSEYGDEISMLKTSDSSDDIVRKTIDMVNGVKISNNVDNAAVMKKIADNAARQAAKQDIGAAHSKYLNMVKEFKIKYATRLNKLIGGDINPNRAIFTTDNPIVSRLAKIKAWENSDRFTDDRIIRLLGDLDDTRLIPLFNKEGLTDLFLLGHGKSAHYFLKKTLAGNKLLRDTKNRYKLAIYSYTIATNSLMLYTIRDLINMVYNFTIGSTSPSELLWSDYNTYTWNFGGPLSPECYELKGHETGDAKEMLPTTIGQKSKDDYIFWVKKQRKSMKDDNWFPEDFCKHFICKDGKPVQINCGKYAPFTGGDGSLAQDYELQKKTGETLEDIERYFVDTLVNSNVKEAENILDQFKIAYEEKTDNVLDSDWFNKLDDNQKSLILQALDKEAKEVKEKVSSSEVGM
jgi:hypothetical protein